MKQLIEVDLPDGYELDVKVDLRSLPGYDSVLVFYGLTDDAGGVHTSTAAFVVRPSENDRPE